MFGRAMKKQVSVTSFKRGGEASVESNFKGDLTKREVLKKVGEWWDNHGSHLDDYDGIQIVIQRKGE